MKELAEQEEFCLRVSEVKHAWAILSKRLLCTFAVYENGSVIYKNVFAIYANMVAYPLGLEKIKATMIYTLRGKIMRSNIILTIIWLLQLQQRARPYREIPGMEVGTSAC